MARILDFLDAKPTVQSPEHDARVTPFSISCSEVRPGFLDVPRNGH